MRPIPFLVLLACLLSTGGCARMIAANLNAPYDAAIREDARYLLESALSNNPAPATFKGIGNIKLTRDSTTQSSRIAWAASVPDNVRIELLTPYGQPAASVSSDGRFVYAILHQDKSFHKRKVGESSFEQILTIPVGPKEVVSILGGRPPVIEYSFVSKIESETAPGPVIVVQESWWGDYEKIYLSDDGRRILGVEVFNGAGELKYRVDFDGFVKDGRYSVPSGLVITDGEGAEARLVVSRFWADADVSPTAFVLEPPVK
jgi:outer membrane lipoprotein-sorting protein